MSWPQCFDLSPAKILVSTVGIPDAMVRCAERFPRARGDGGSSAALRARQMQRESLIPLARRYPLEMLRTAIERVNLLQQRPLMVEYLLLDGLTDTDEDLRELIAYLRGLRVHVNLIPYNPISEDTGLIGTGVERRRWFAAALLDAGFTATMSLLHWEPMSRRRAGATGVRAWYRIEIGDVNVSRASLYSRDALRTEHLNFGPDKVIEQQLPARLAATRHSGARPA